MGGIGCIWVLVGFTAEEAEREQLPYQSDQYNFFFFFFAFKAEMMRFSHVALVSQRLNLTFGLNMKMSVDT